MKAFYAFLAVLWTLMLAAIGVQLYQINQNLSWVSAPIKGLAGLSEPRTVSGRPETREERRERYAKENQEMCEDMADRLGVPSTSCAPKKAASARPAQK